MKSIRKWLEDDAGVTLSITSLTSYISRIRRRATQPAVPPQVGANEVAASKAPEDPLAQAKRVLSQPKLDIRKLHNDGDPEGRNLI